MWEESPGRIRHMQNGEELQKLHLILGSPDSARSVMASPPLVWCLLTLNYFLKTNKFQCKTIAIYGSKTVTINASSVTRSR